jgi:hypothetical protein
MTPADELQLLLDERAIQRCIARYCHGTDRQDWQTVIDAYVPGALDDHGSFQGTVEEFAEWLANKSANRGAKQHYIANQLIEIAGDDAVCESYYLCYIEFTADREFADSDEPTAVLMGGRYVDRLTRFEGDWRIAHRGVLLDWTRDLGRPAPWSAPAAAHFARGRSDGQDPGSLGLAEMVRLRAELPTY